MPAAQHGVAIYETAHPGSLAVGDDDLHRRIALHKGGPMFTGTQAQAGAAGRGSALAGLVASSHEAIGYLGAPFASSTAGQTARLISSKVASGRMGFFHGTGPDCSHKDAGIAGPIRSMTLASTEVFESCVVWLRYLLQNR